MPYGDVTDRINDQIVVFEQLGRLNYSNDIRFVFMFLMISCNICGRSTSRI